MTAPIGTDIDRAASLITGGGLVAFATETVYGLGANAYDVRAVGRIFEVKERPQFDPLIVHVGAPAWVRNVAATVTPLARRLIDAFWPGPLTLVLPKCDRIPYLATAGLETVGVRMPSHPSALDLLLRANVPIAAPSANLFGHVSPTTAQHVAEQLGERIDYILDGGPCTVGVESTIVEVSGDEPALLRPGGLALEALEAVIGPIRVAEATSDENQPQPSPGCSLRHYATRTRLVIADAAQTLSSPEQCGLLTLTAQPGDERYAAVEVLSERGDLAEAAANLFAAMRRLDARGFKAIVARLVPETGLGRAINDRLRRAALTASVRVVNEKLLNRRANS
ncbi:MAG TPA: L-threonylcarbamoyladenylate synthase [Planctomycetaceae bacterium]|nr:L-threonylcarbamoyladenylate synthase [Planctomycetaceae bacterium]